MLHLSETVILGKDHTCLKLTGLYPVQLGHQRPDTLIPTSNRSNIWVGFLIPIYTDRFHKKRFVLIVIEGTSSPLPPKKTL